MRWYLLALSLAAVAPAALIAQTSTAMLDGIVRTSEGEPAGASRVDIRNRETGAARLTVTAGDGGYQFAGLEPGEYDLTARAIGYRAVRRTGLRVVVGERLRVNLTLERGPVELEPVIVTAEATPEIDRSDVSTAVLATEIERLPLNARDVLALAAIAPGIRYSASATGRSIPASGAMTAPRFVNLYVDGEQWKGLVYGAVVGVPQTGSLIPIEAIREYRVSLNPYDVEYSGGASWIISAVTHQGGNTFHGSLSGFEQNRTLVAKGAFQDVKPHYERQQYGAHLRGPVVRDHLFFSVSYGGEITSNYLTVVPGGPSSNPTIWSRYAGTFRSPVENQSGLARLTFLHGPHTLDGSWSARQLRTTAGFGAKTATGVVLSRDAGIISSYRVSSAQLRDRYASASLLNELSLNALLTNDADRQSMPGPTFQYPGIQIGRTTYPSISIGRRIGVSEKLSLTPARFGGRHVLKAGVEVMHASGSGFLPASADGFFMFKADTSTLPNVAQIGVGYPDSTGTSDARHAMGGWLAGAYLQDQWRARKRLVLTFGIRYDAALNTLQQSSAAPWASDTVLRRVVGDRYLNSGDRKNDLDNVAPRAALAWDVGGDARTFLRAGYGVMYDWSQVSGAFSEQLAWSWRTYTFSNPGTTDPDELRRRVLAGGGTPLPLNLVLLPDRLATPSNRQWSLGIGRRLSDNLALNLDWLDQHAVHLPVTVKANQLRPDRTRPLTSRYGNITLWGDFGEARFRALLGSLTFTRDATRVTAAYTLGWARSNFGSVTTSDYPDSAAYVMQRSNGDERHRLVLSAMTGLPFGLQFSTISTVASPRPVFAFAGTDANGNGPVDDDWPNGVRTFRPGGWSNWYRTVDVRLAKPFRVAQGTMIATADVFNLANWRNHSDYQTVAAAANFGAATADSPGRQAQVGLRYQF